MDAILGILCLHDTMGVTKLCVKSMLKRSPTQYPRPEGRVENLSPYMPYLKWIYKLTPAERLCKESKKFGIEPHAHLARVVNAPMSLQPLFMGLWPSDCFARKKDNLRTFAQRWHPVEMTSNYAYKMGRNTPPRRLVSHNWGAFFLRIFVKCFMRFADKKCRPVVYL
jgi:hypothetical protein